jgi:hypothetical protein
MLHINQNSPTCSIDGGIRFYIASPLTTSHSLAIHSYIYIYILFFHVIYIIDFIFMTSFMIWYSFYVCRLCVQEIYFHCFQHTHHLTFTYNFSNWHIIDLNELLLVSRIINSLLNRGNHMNVEALIMPPTPYITLNSPISNLM